jgi:hypothetical protein
MFTAAQCTTAKLWNQLKCPSTDDEMWYIHTMEYYSAIKNEIMSFARKWMELEINTLRKISQTQ